MKRFFRIALFLIVICAMFALVFSACKGVDADPGNEPSEATPSNQTTESKGLTYELLNDGTYAVTSIGTCTDNFLIIPATYEGKAVTYIAENAFRDCSFLVSVTIPESMEFIDENAFANCYRLVEVYNQSSLNIVQGNGDLGDVGWFAMNIYNQAGGSKLSTDENGYVLYTDGDLISLIGYFGSDTVLTLPAGITEINYYAFYGCSDLTSITLPDTVAMIEDSAFYGCSDSVYNEYGNALYLGNEANPYLALIKAKNNTITQCTIHRNTKLIVLRSFRDCTDLTSLVVENGNPSYHSAGNCLIKTNSKELIFGCKNSVIPSDGSVTVIDRSAFSNRSGLTSITIPANITEIGSAAFYECSDLTSVTIAEGSKLTLIDEITFADCSKLSMITIPEGVTSIGVQAFRDCVSLPSITIPASVTSIEEGAFNGCDRLVEVYNLSALNITKGSEDHGNVGYYAKSVNTELSKSKISTDENGYVLYTDGDLISLIGYFGSDTTLTLPAGITEINQEAFSDCSDLTSVVIPNSVTSIGVYAFYQCKGLTSVIFSQDSQIKSIHYGAFIGCSKLTYNEYENALYLGNSENPYVALIKVKNTSITECRIHENTKAICDRTFSGCSGLTTISIPEGVTNIGDWTFSGCSGLTSITFQGTKDQWNAITKGNDWNKSTGKYTIHCEDGDIEKE